LAQKDERPYGTKLKALLLLIISLISFGFGMSVLTGTISSWLFVIAEILLVLIMSIPILFIPTLVEGFLFIHEFLRLRLFHSILDQEEPSISQVIIVSVLLNFSFFTLAYTTSLRESIIAVIPILASVRMMLPSSAIDLFQTLARISLENVGLSYFVAALVFCPLGPSLVLGARWERRKRAVRLTKLFEFLQILVYLSVILLVYSIIRGVPPSEASLDVYVNLLIMIVLPGTTGGIGLILMAMPGVLERFDVHA